MTHRSVPLVGGGLLPLAFIGFALAALAAGAAWPALSPALLQLPHLHPHVAALAHVWLPGFLLSASLGAMYQLAPVVLGAALRGGVVVPWIHWGIHAAGVVALAGGFVLGRFEIVALGGTLISVGVAGFAVVLARTFLASTRRDAIAWSFALATGWLGATVAAGVLIAVNKRWPFLPWSSLTLLPAHAHLGLIGFFLTLLQGATFQLIPMFAMAELRGRRAVAAGLGGSQAGLVVLTAGLLGGLPALKLGGAALLWGGIASSGAALALTLRTRRRRKLEAGVRAFLIGASLLALAAVCGAMLLAAPMHASGERALMGYGLIAIAGGLTLAVLGMLGKILPFLVWMRAYGPRVGRAHVPLATALGSPLLERWWLRLHLGGLSVIVLGVLLDEIVIVATGAWLLAGGVGFFLAHAGRILAHLKTPALPLPLPRGAGAPIPAAR